MAVFTRTKGLVERSLVLGFIAVACLLGLCAAIAAWNGSEVINSADRLENSYQVLQALTVTEADLTAAESAARGYFTAGHEEFAAEFQSDRQSAVRSFDGLAGISDGDVTRRKSLASIRNALELRLQDLSGAISFRRTHGLAALLNRPDSQLMRSDRLHLAVLLAGVRRSEEQSILTRRNQSTSSTRLATTSFWLASLIGAAGVSGFFVLVSRLLQAQQALKAVEVSRTHELEHRVVERTAELTEAIADLEAFSYSVSHDLRTPLRAISGYSSMVEENLGGSGQTENRDLLQRVRSNCVRMSALMDALMNLAMLSRSELTPAEIDISKLAAEVVTETLAEEPQRNIRVRIEPGLKAFGDPAMIRILVANLIGNAAKFTGKVEKASIEMGRLPSEDGGFFVRDNGAGFDQAFASSIFKPFERLHRESEFKGTGIGLATCAKIVRRHGGKIWIESEIGRGATVSFVLPVLCRTDSGSPEQQASPSQISPSAR